ncbi:MAG: lectin-like protein [Oscillospiraceae bacterium]
MPTAQEMFHKPEQELSDVERMMLAILTEEAAAPEPEAEPEPETPAEEPAAEEVPAEEVSAEELVLEEPAAEEAPGSAGDRARGTGTGSQARNPGCRAGNEARGTPRTGSQAREPGSRTAARAGAEARTQPLPNKFRPEKPAAKPETPAKPKPERKPEKPPAKKPEAYRPAPKKREPDEQRQSHKAGILLTVLIICAAVLAVLLLRSLGVFGTPTTAETTPTPTVPVETAVPTETPTPTPTPKPEPTYEVVTADVSWADAEAAAEAKGGHLVVIDSAEKWTRVAQLADESGLTYVWIGLHRTDSGELAWVKDNVDPVYNWASGEPSVHDTNGAAEDYVLITRTNSGWYYNDCIGDPAGRYPQFYSGKIGYIIEIDP